jgi:hypothetical protein
MTEKKLALRTGSTIKNPSTMSTSGMTFFHKQPSDMMKNTASDMMRNMPKSPRSYQTENRFVKTEWVPEKSYEKPKEIRMEKSVKESRPLKENKPV